MGTRVKELWARLHRIITKSLVLKDIDKLGTPYTKFYKVPRYGTSRRNCRPPLRILGACLQFVCGWFNLAGYCGCPGVPRVQSSCEADDRSFGQNITLLRQRLHNSAPLYPILCLLSLKHLTLFLRFRFDTTVTATPRSPNWYFTLRVSFHSRVCVCICMYLSWSRCEVAGVARGEVGLESQLISIQNYCFITCTCTQKTRLTNWSTCTW